MVIQLRRKFRDQFAHLLFLLIRWPPLLTSLVMDRILLLDLQVKKTIDNFVSTKSPNIPQFQRALFQIETKLATLLPLADQDDFLEDECELLTSQVALLKKMINDALKREQMSSTNYIDAIELDKEDEGAEELASDDETLNLIAKLKSDNLLVSKPKRSDENEPPKLGSPTVKRRKVKSQKEAEVESQTGSEKTEEEAPTQESEDKEIDEIAEQMLEHTRQLKYHTHTFKTLLNEDNKVLNEAEQALSNASDRFHRESGNLQALTKKARKSTWRAILYAFFIVIVTFFMIIFIKITSK